LFEGTPFPFLKTSAQAIAFSCVHG
ncbi:hypothetical protein BAE44_0021793, partial [Dichanthelium oligosanthes]